ASHVCGASGIWGHVYRGDGRVRGLEAGGAGISKEFYFLAGAWNIGFGYGSESGHNGGLVCSAWPFDVGDDGAAVEPDSNFSCAAVPHAARNLHRAGEELE